MNYDDIYLEGYYDALLEAEKTSRKESNDDYSYSQKSKKDNGKYSKTTKVSINGDSALMRAYDRYVTRCQSKGKHPMPFTKWVKINAGVAAVGTTAVVAGGVIGGRKLYKNHKAKKAAQTNPVNEAYADGYYAALCEIEEIEEV